jgi:hypothetical protein
MLTKRSYTKGEKYFEASLQYKRLFQQARVNYKASSKTHPFIVKND